MKNELEAAPQMLSQMAMHNRSSNLGADAGGSDNIQDIYEELN